MSTYTVTCSNPFHRHTTVSVGGTEEEVSFTLDKRRGKAVATDVPADVADVLAEDPAYTVHGRGDAPASDTDPSNQKATDDEPAQDESTQDNSAGDDPEQDDSDDLTAISGVGPATEATLQEAGITTFAALAEATAVEGLSDEQLDDLRGKAKAHLTAAQ